MIKVLVAEDEIYARASLVKQIRQYDKNGMFSIFEAANGEEALEIAEKENPGLILSDIRMPKLDGLELLHKIKQRNTDTHFIIVSAFQDFEYCHRAITDGAADYLLKPIEMSRLEACMDKFFTGTARRYREDNCDESDNLTRFIRSCIEEGDAGSGQFVGQRIFGHVFPEYKVLLICFREDVKDKEMCVTSAAAEAAALYTQTGMRIYRRNKRQWCMVMRWGENAYFFPRKLLERIREKLDIPVDIGISREYRKLEELPAASREAEEAVSYRFWSDEGIYDAEKFTPDAYPHYQIGAEQEFALKEALRNNDISQYETILNNIFKEIKETGFIRYESMQVILAQLQLYLRKSLLGEEWEQTQKAGSVNVLDFPALESMNCYLLMIGKNMMQMRLNAGTDRSDDVVERITGYAAEHIEDGITLKEIAETVLHMNSSYISHLFTEKTGMNFSLWLRRKRIEEAKRLLQNGKMSITEIALRVGYNDTSLFIKNFKHETGVTPKKYQMMEVS